MRAPDTITVRVCQTCGQSDIHNTMGRTTHKRPDAGGGWCMGVPEEIVYVRRQPRTLRKPPPLPQTIDELVSTLSPHEWEWTIIGDNYIGVWNLARTWRKGGDVRTEEEIVAAIAPGIYRRWEEEVYGPWHAEDYEQEGQAA